MEDSEYCYEATSICDAHQWCGAMKRVALNDSESMRVATAITRIVEKRNPAWRCVTRRVYHSSRTLRGLFAQAKCAASEPFLIRVC